MKEQNDFLSNEDIEINLAKFVYNIWMLREKICKVACVGALIGLIIGFSIPKQYTVSVTLAPEMSSNKGNSGLASMAASFLGGGFSQSGSDALNALLAPEIVCSTPFLMEMLDSRVTSEKANIDLTFSEYLETESVPWWNTIVRVPGMIIGGVKSLFVEPDSTIVYCDKQSSVISLSKKDYQKITSLKKRLSVSVNKKTSIITLTTSFQDPEITAVVVDSVLSKLQKYIINYKVSKAEDDYCYWKKITNESKEKYYDVQQQYAQYVDANNNVILQSTMVERERLQNEMNLAFQTYSQVAQQLQLAQAKVQESKPAFTIVEPSVVPNISTSMGKMKLMLVFAVLAMVGFVIWEFFIKNLFSRLNDNPVD